MVENSEIGLSADDEFFFPMYAWFSGNKVIFITNDDGVNEENRQVLGEIAKPYLIKYPSGLTDSTIS
ncbi:MAG TPA: hypothetical protein QGG70_03500 [Candidatus Pacearchaeota archaeon]|nr:hypothetical protein [Candidatus Pacearchaeota archaeon]